jgi:hypothetical protein
MQGVRSPAPSASRNSATRRPRTRPSSRCSRVSLSRAACARSASFGAPLGTLMAIGLDARPGHRAAGACSTADLPPPLPPGHPIVDGKIRRFGGARRSAGTSSSITRRATASATSPARSVAGRAPTTARSSSRPTSPASSRTSSRRCSARRPATSTASVRSVRNARFAGNRARQQWDSGRARIGDGETVPYLARKRLQWENGLRVYTDGTLLVPMVRYDVTEEQEKDPAYTGAAAPGRPAEDQARRLQALQQGHGPDRRGVPLRAEAEGRRALHHRRRPRHRALVAPGARARVHLVGRVHRGQPRCRWPGSCARCIRSRRSCSSPMTTPTSRRSSTSG